MTLGVEYDSVDMVRVIEEWASGRNERMRVKTDM